MSAWFAMRLKQTLFDSPGVPLPEKRSTATNSLVPPLLMALLRILMVPVPVPPRAPARRPTPRPARLVPGERAAAPASCGPSLVEGVLRVLEGAGPVAAGRAGAEADTVAGDGVAV